MQATGEKGAGGMGRPQLKFPARGESQRQSQRCRYNLGWDVWRQGFVYEEGQVVVVEVRLIF